MKRPPSECLTLRVRALRPEKRTDNPCGRSLSQGFWVLLSTSSSVRTVEEEGGYD